MAKSTITREESVQAVFDLKVGYRLGFSDIEILKRVARMALAAMDSEPVAYMYDGEDGREYNGHNEFSGGGKGIPLYRHMQAAPDGEQLAIENFRSAMEGIGHIRRTLEETFGGLHGTHVEPDVLMECKTICDAIYAAYSGNSPVIPESYSAKFGNFQHYWHSKGYVMVPKEPTEAMCDISHIGVDVYCGITDDNEYYSIGGAEAAKVWKAMLAAAPQEVKGE
ncbi:hypothetical protein [Klebsiella pneumoniae]|uniref:Uncharacterized protein n=1 Tax=Klebsiella pneumoniae TaxID=573 RepID=A0A7X2GNM8_KLEPN|nr:hypothetical protein [Klebsiella pneumoniae]MBF8075913.1 hypothetical protein [Klebsiella pneumoniae]MBZ7058591.1 hypothetical protein [Klebsiella pneumoniae]MDK1655541.1 hypothetical protein [Klebsiella pneumoniae]MDU9099845.1 hypothetical protein [Klebsiella pneumoniae]MDU9111472.1 hypothetical protein [Klebsiella pneumoniae]